MSDSDIVNRLINKDERALKMIAEKYRTSGMSIAIKRLGNREDAEEAFNDALFAIWKKTKELKLIFQNDSAFFRAYFLQTVNNSAKMIQRRKRTKKRMPEGGVIPIEELNNDFADPLCIETEVENNELRNIVVEFLLNPMEIMQEERKVFAYSHFQGLRYSEISRKLNIPYARVRAMERKVREKLIKKLKEEGYYV